MTGTPPGPGAVVARTVISVSETLWITARLVPKYTSIAPARLRPVRVISSSLPVTGPESGLMPVRAGNGV